MDARVRTKTYFIEISFRKVLTLMCFHVILFKIIPHYSDVLYLVCLLAFAYEQFSFLFTLKKEFINRASLNLSARDETGSLYITTVLFIWSRGLQTNNMMIHCPLSWRITFSSYAFLIKRHHGLQPLHPSMTAEVFHKNYESMKFKSMKCDHISFVASVHELFPFALQNSTTAGRKKRKFFCFAYPDFFRDSFFHRNEL
jgi:hypothetical protein